MHRAFKEVADAPDFIRYSIDPDDASAAPSTFPAHTAFFEGWGLYSEYLGYELGIYENEPIKELGYIMGDLLRSARLVVDTGLHRFGWSKERAVEFLMKNSAFSLAAAKAEVDRYITLPAQAVSYKVGERKIHQLRHLFVQEQGFDLKDFHEFFLACEGPLQDLQDCIASHFQES